MIDNRVGANTNIGNEAVAKSVPDGYTLLMAASTLTINASLCANLPYDAVKSFAPVTLVTTTLLGGQISLMFPGAPIALPQVQAGKLRALAVTGDKRSALNR